MNDAHNLKAKQKLTQLTLRQSYVDLIKDCKLVHTKSRQRQVSGRGGPLKPRILGQAVNPLVIGRCS